MKLALYLLRLTGEARYGDGLERTLYNTLLAVRMPDSDGGYPYYSNYGANAVKKYYHRNGRAVPARWWWRRGLCAECVFSR
ncbi:MAG: glycoside hydrolase family 127 protein [Blastocatellia bacterium]